MASSFLNSSGDRPSSLIVGYYDPPKSTNTFLASIHDSPNEGSDGDDGECEGSTGTSIPPRIAMPPFDDIPFSQSFSGYIDEGRSIFFVRNGYSERDNETVDMTFHLDHFTNIRDDLDSQWSDDDIDEIMVMSPKDYSAPLPPRKLRDQADVSRVAADTTFSDFEVLRDGVLDLSVSKSKVRLCKSRRTGEVYMMKSLQDCDQIVWSEEPNAPLPSSPVVTSCRLSRVPDKDDVFRFSSFPISTEPPLRHTTYPSASSPTICTPPSSPPPNAGRRVYTPLLPELTRPSSVGTNEGLAKFRYPSCPVIEEEVEVPPLTLTPMLQEQPQLTAEERMDLFWESIDREAAAVRNASAPSLSPKWLKHRASVVDVLLHKPRAVLSSAPNRLLRAQKSTPTLAQAEVVPIALPEGLQQIGNGIGFTYHVPAAAASKSSIFTTSRGSVLRRLSDLRVHVPRLRRARKKSALAVRSEDPLDRLSIDDDQDIMDIVNVYGESPWSLVPSPPTSSVPFAATLSPDPFRAMSSCASTPLSSSGPLTPQTPYGNAMLRGSYDLARGSKNNDDGLRLVAASPLGLNELI